MSADITSVSDKKGREKKLGPTYILLSNPSLVFFGKCTGCNETSNLNELDMKKLGKWPIGPQFRNL